MRCHSRFRKSSEAVQRSTSRVVHALIQRLAPPAPFVFQVRAHFSFKLHPPARMPLYTGTTPAPLALKRDRTRADDPRRARKFRFPRLASRYDALRTLSHPNRPLASAFVPCSIFPDLPVAVCADRIPSDTLFLRVPLFAASLCANAVRCLALMCTRSTLAFSCGDPLNATGAD